MPLAGINAQLLRRKLDLLLKDLKKELQAFYGSRLLSVVVFGSVGRGDLHPESDIKGMLRQVGIEPPSALQHELVPHARIGSLEAESLQPMSGFCTGYRGQPAHLAHKLLGDANCGTPQSRDGQSFGNAEE